MEKHNSKLRRRWAEARAVWDESALRSQTELSKLYKFAHFCVMVWRSFTRNRCPVRASALAYASLLALIPMLAVVMSITSTFLKKEGEQRIEDTFNDIWGVARGRSWFMRIVLYWGVISLMPLLLVVALGLATGSHLESTRQFILANPFISRLTFQLLPVVVLCFTFGLLYM